MHAYFEDSHQSDQGLLCLSISIYMLYVFNINHSLGYFSGRHFDDTLFFVVVVFFFLFLFFLFFFVLFFFFLFVFGFVLFCFVLFIVLVFLLLLLFILFLYFIIFFPFFPRKWTDIICKLSSKATTYIECQSLLSGENKKTFAKCRLMKLIPSI